MRERPDVPFAFLQDLLDDEDEPYTRAPGDAADPALSGSKAAVLDATANVLAALRQWLQVTEDMVRLRRDRLIEENEEPPVPAPPQEHRGRERVDLTY
jgi:hypothetical protein